MALFKSDIERFNTYMIQEFMENEEMMKKLFQKFLELKDKSVNKAGENDNQPIDIQDIKSKSYNGKVYEPKTIEKIVEVPVEKIVEIEVEKIVYQESVIEKPVEVVPDWVGSLEPFYAEIEFFNQVINEPELANILLPEQSSNIKQLVVTASQWHTILRAWDEIASMVKSHQQAISQTQTDILTHCLELYNLTLGSRHARLDYPSIQDSYDYESHESILGNGGSISQVLLPSLVNAGDERVRTALVATR